MPSARAVFCAPPCVTVLAPARLRRVSLIFGMHSVISLPSAFTAAVLSCTVLEARCQLRSPTASVFDTREKTEGDWRAAHFGFCLHFSPLFLSSLNSSALTFNASSTVRVRDEYIHSCRASTVHVQYSYSNASSWILRSQLSVAALSLWAVPVLRPRVVVTAV